MKKLISTIAAALTVTLLTVPALADIIWEPRPTPPTEDAVSSAAESGSALVPVLAIAVVVIAAAVLARAIIKRRRAL